MPHQKNLLAYLENTVITPRLHRLHHHHSATSTEYRNLGFLFSIWDKLFELYRSDTPLSEQYGIEDQNFPYSSVLKQWLKPTR
jgi:sterol desaturase/sphingolipid hydroxylase (fatty acid hydroxylase superfamily)